MSESAHTQKISNMEFIFFLSGTYINCARVLHSNYTHYSCFVLFFCLFFLPFSWAALAVYGGSQARGLIGAVATSLCHSHSKQSELCLQPTPQLTTALLDPLSKARIKPATSWFLVCCTTMGTPILFFFMANIPLCIRTTSSSSIHLLVDM